MPPISVEGLTAENVTELSETCRQKMLAVYDQISIEAAEKFETGQFWLETFCFCLLLIASKALLSI